MIVLVLQAVEMDRERQVWAWRELIDLLLEEQRVGAQVDELLARDDALDDLDDLLVEQWLAAGDRDHRSAAFVDGFEALGRGQALVQDLIGVVDLAAAGA